MISLSYLYAISLSRPSFLARAADWSPATPRRRQIRSSILGGWNHYYVKALGHHVEGWLNGVKTVDVVDEGGKLTGPIGFQLCHGDKATDASFRSLHVRAIRPPRSPSYFAVGPSSASRTARASLSLVNGFSSKTTPSPSTPWCEMAPSV